ncbi:zeta toxin family protein [Aquirufa nivalisilvae]|uniref:zeta toxin family protein n=1 Tax=Aquirufa nivalisilvae TaxID=2516557 RepID=UPI001E58AC44
MAGCNGAGKTTASNTILPEILDCKEFVNADEIAKSLSPFQPEKVAFESGRIMLARIDELLLKGESFSFETTLAAKSYQNLIKEAQNKGFIVFLLFFWLRSIDLAKERVVIRVKEGGHYIPENVIERRYKAGITNLFHIYLPLVDAWLIYDNSDSEPDYIASKDQGGICKIKNVIKWQQLNQTR